MKSEYQKQASDFLTATGTEIKIQFLRNGKYFPDDTEPRDLYEVTMKRGSRTYTFTFGQSIAKSGFYFTVGRQKFEIPREYLSSVNIVAIAKRINPAFLKNRKSDIIHKPEEPTPYDILACLTKYNPESFDDFCSEYGYSNDSISAKKTYKAVRSEYLSLAAMYSDAEMELLQEIQ